jgi:hypothetical protein
MIKKLLQSISKLTNNNDENFIIVRDRLSWSLS